MHNVDGRHGNKWGRTKVKIQYQGVHKLLDKITLLLNLFRVTYARNDGIVVVDRPKVHFRESRTNMRKLGRVSLSDRAKTI